MPVYSPFQMSIHKELTLVGQATEMSMYVAPMKINFCKCQTAYTAVNTWYGCLVCMTDYLTEFWKNKYFS